MLVFSGTQEVEMGKMVQGQLGKKVNKTISIVVGHTCNPSYAKQKSAWSMAQVVEHLPSKCRTLTSSPSTAKQKGYRYKL
jgi:hypothetical protein